MRDASSGEPSLVRRWPSLASSKVDFYCHWTSVRGLRKGVLPDVPAAAGSLDPGAGRVNPGTAAVLGCD